MAAWLEWVRTNWLLLSVILAIVLAFVLLRTSPSSEIDSLDTLDATVSAGQPVVIEFYSNF